MRVRNVRHKGLKRFIEADDSAGLPAQYVQKIRNILSFLSEMGAVSELRAIPAWKAHQFSGDRKGTRALHVTRNWRIAFAIDQDDNEITDLDYEDCH